MGSILIYMKYHSLEHSIQQLRWLLTESKSGWDDLNDDERIALFKQSRDLYNEVFVFV
jgi:hypothetical protein